MSPEVEDLCPAWYPCKHDSDKVRLTPGQVQRGAERFIAKLGTPASTPRPAGKGQGRAKGYRPVPRIRYAVVCKGLKDPKKASATT